MIIYNTSKKDITTALSFTSEAFRDNLLLLICEPLNKAETTFHVRLTVKRSDGMGAKVGHNGRRVKAACWHAHGIFFDELFCLSPSARIKSRGRLITKDKGNWEDENIGSVILPRMFSQSCKCPSFR